MGTIAEPVIKLTFKEVIQLASRANQTRILKDQHGQQISLHRQN
jgi:hypothetical protein